MIQTNDPKVIKEVEKLQKKKQELVKIVQQKEEEYQEALRSLDKLEDEIEHKITFDIQKFVNKCVKIESRIVGIDTVYDYWYVDGIESASNDIDNTFIVKGITISDDKVCCLDKTWSRYKFDQYTKIIEIPKEEFAEQFSKRVDEANKIIKSIK